MKNANAKGFDKDQAVQFILVQEPRQKKEGC